MRYLVCSRLNKGVLFFKTTLSIYQKVNWGLSIDNTLFVNVCHVCLLYYAPHALICIFIRLDIT